MAEECIPDRIADIENRLTNLETISVGPQGPQGEAATAVIGVITTVSPDTAADVDNVGTPEEAILDFKIPMGETGPQGNQGTTGLTGSPGYLSYATYALMAAATSTAGNTGYVYGPDTGTHTDPVVGGIVKNEGIYAYSTAPAGWRRVSDLEASGLLFDSAALIPANSETVVEGQRRTTRRDKTTPGIDSSVFLKSTQENVPLVFPIGAPNHFAHASWTMASPGFLEDGKLREIEVRTKGVVTGAGPNILQVALMRARNDVLTTTNGAAQIFDPHALVGEVNLLPDQAVYPYNEVFAGMEIDIPVGALVIPVFRTIGFGMLYGANSGGTHEYDGLASVSVGIVNQTLAAFETSFTANILTGVSGGRQFGYKAVVAKGETATSDGANGAVYSDSDGKLPFYIGRPRDTLIVNKKIAVIGTSFSTPSGGGISTHQGHIKQAMAALGCNWLDLAIGGSTELWKSASPSGVSLENQTIGATADELIARFGAPFAQWSYENRLLSKGVDGVVFGDLINAANIAPSAVNGQPFTLGNKGDTTPDTVWGCWVRMAEAFYAENPNGRIWLQVPGHEYAAYPTPGLLPTVQSNRRIWRDGIYEIAKEIRAAGVIDYLDEVNCTPKVVQAGNGLVDTIHWTQTMKDRAAQVVYNSMKNY